MCRASAPSLLDGTVGEVENGTGDSGVGTAMTPAGRRDLIALPKAHLHVHLEGAVRPTTLQELALQAGLTPVGAVTPGDFGAFINAYQTACNAISDHEDLARVVDELVEDEQAQGVSWLEVTVDPWLHTERLGSVWSVMETLTDAARQASERHNVGVGLIVAVDRTRSLAAGLASAELAVEFSERGVVALGLANDERAGRAADFTAAFDLARAAGLASVPHAGELDGPLSVRDAVQLLGARRVGHGTRAIEDDSVVRLLVANGVGVEVCLTSNEFLSVCSVADHPLVSYLEAGVACSLAGDDPTFFASGVVSEYQRARDELSLTDEQLAGLAQASFVTSCADAEIVARGLAGVASWLNRSETH